MLRGLISCSECGRAMLGPEADRVLQACYRCSSHIGGVGRSLVGKAIRADFIEPLIWEQCLGFASIRDIIDNFALRWNESNPEKSLKIEVAQMDSALQVSAGAPESST